MHDPEEDIDAYCLARVGSMIRDKWRLDRMLGIGGMAAVYAATHRNGSIAALKVLHPQYASIGSLRERFLREAYIANKTAHEGIVKVRDDEVDENGSPYLVMELLEGESVADKADSMGGRLMLKDAVWVGSQLLGVLEAAHAHGIVHRDIKPDNIFWTSDGRLKVLDFGIARLREDAPSNRTRTGMVFGTPGYMAPEQALGRWSDVDARTDLWAVGATIFNLLTGQSVHEGETENERLVNAATRPARSLGSALPGAPTRLVMVIDRSLDFDQKKRYPDAATMKRDLDRAAADVGRPSGDMPRTYSSRAMPATRIEEPAPALPPSAENVDEAGEVQEIAEILADVSPSTIAATRELFVLLEKAMKARSQYGKDHKEVERRLEAAFAFVTSAFATEKEPLAWNVRSYGFTVADQTLWEPKPPLDQVCYRLFSDGIRAMALLPGLTQPELAELVRILVADASSEIAPEDNVVTLLWEARFDNVLYEEADSFAEGDQAERAAFEKKRAEVLAGASLDTADQLEDAWNANAQQTSPEDHEAKQRALVGTVAGGGAASAAAQAASMKVGKGRADVLAVDAATRSVMAARLASSDDVGQRFASAAASAFVLAYRNRDPGLVAGPIRTAVEALDGPSVASDTLAFVALLETSASALAEPDEVEPMMAALVKAVVSPRRLAVLVAAAVDPAATKEVCERFGAVLRRLDGSHVATLTAAFSTMEGSSVRGHLLDYIAAHADGREGEIGAAFAKGHLEPSLALLKVLTGLKSRAAREAAQEATKSPHPIVRIEALGLVEGASGVGIRQALRAMLEDWDPAVRLAALQSIGAYKVKVAGPALVLRIKSPEFDALPPDERREALSTVFMLTGTRAEAVCLELLADTRLVTTDPHEQSRAIAAEMLGLYGRGADAKEALEAASKGRWKNSERVRAAATTALKEWTDRGTRASEPPPPSSQVGLDRPAWRQTEAPPPMSKIPPPMSKR